MHLIPLLCLALSPIQIDGSFNDWADGVTSQEDAQYFYKLVSLPWDACLQQLPEQKIVELGDYTIFFSPKGKGYGVSCKKGDEWISTYEAGIVFAPTTASKKFEIRVNKPSLELPVHPFTFSKKGDFRVVSWNVQLGNLLDDRKRSARILKALQPTALLLQELDGDDTPEILSQFLTETLGENWHVGMSTVYGTKRHHQIRSAIATSQNATFDAGGDELKALASVFNIDEEPITFVSLHLRCCGGPTGESEEQRIAEASEVRKNIDLFQSKRWVIGGDWNLVGTMKPLKIVMSDDLAIVNAFQPDGLLNATWSDSTSSFTPGRLDWILYTPTSLKVVNSFVLDTGDLNIDSLIAYDLLSEDTAELSDHLPLVADFKILK